MNPNMTSNPNNFENAGRSSGAETRYDQTQGFRMGNPGEGTRDLQQDTNFGSDRTSDSNYIHGTQGSGTHHPGPGGGFGASTIGGTDSRNFSTGQKDLSSQHHTGFERAAEVAFGTKPGVGATGFSNPDQNRTSGLGMDEFDDRKGFRGGSGPMGGQFSNDFVPSSGLSSTDRDTSRSGARINNDNESSGGDFQSRERLASREFERGREQDKSLSDQVSNLKRDIANSGSSNEQDLRDSNF